MIFRDKVEMDISVVSRGNLTCKLMCDAFKDLSIVKISPTKILIEAPVKNEWFSMQIARCEWFMLGLERGYTLEM